MNDKIPTILQHEESKSRPLESINTFFFTLPQLMDYYECKEKSNFKSNVFKAMFGKIMREKYGCTIFGFPIDSDEENDDEENE